MEFEETADHPLRLASINGHEDGRSVQVYDQDIATRAEYYHKDHLGNVRLTFSDLNQDGALTVRSIYDPTNEILLEKNYYPFGLEQTGPWFATVAPDNAYRYNGKELDEATGLYDYGARYYDPAVARFPSIDRFAEKFAWQSPYVYAGNNPIKFIDVNGDSINVKQLQETNPTAWNRIKSDLSEITGLTLTVNGKGMLNYSLPQGVIGGSSTARERLIRAISKRKTVSVSEGLSNYASARKVDINAQDIQDLIDGTSSDLDKRTFGFGMTFLHELGHTSLLGKKNDYLNSDGDQLASNVVVMNTIREELGPNFGIRASYKTYTIDRVPYEPWSHSALNSLREGKVPNSGFIVRNDLRRKWGLPLLKY